MMEARAKHQSVVVSVVLIVSVLSVAKIVDCVSPVKGAVALGKIEIEIFSPSTFKSKKRKLNGQNMG